MFDAPTVDDRPARWVDYALWTTAGMALLLLTGWSVTYHWLASTGGQAMLVEQLKLPPGVTVGAVRWGPMIDEIVVADVRVADAGRELVQVHAAGVDLGLGALLGGDVVVDALDVEVTRADVARRKDGLVDLVAVLAPPRAPSVATGPKREAKPVVARNITVHVRDLWLDVPEVHAHVRNLTLTGQVVGTSGGFVLDVGQAHAAWDRWRKSVAVDALRVVARVEETKVEVGLQLAQGQDMSINGTITIAGEDSTSHWSGWGRIEPHVANALVGGFPQGFDFDGLDIATAGSKASGALGSLVIPSWEAGPFRADNIALGVAHLAIEPALLVPKAALRIEGLSVASLQGLDNTLEGLWVPLVVAELDKKLGVTLAGQSTNWITPKGDIGGVSLVAASELKLSGGPTLVRLETDLGVVQATGNLKTSVLTKRTEFIIDARFGDVRGPLAAMLLHDLDDDQTKALGPGPSGSAEIEVDVARDDRFSPWVTELEWALGRLDAACPRAQATCPAYEWDGYGWGVVEAAAESP